jgi:hypothetical protein
MCSIIDQEKSRCVNYFCSCEYFYVDKSPWLSGGYRKRTMLNKYIGQLFNLWRTESNVIAWQYRYADTRTIYNRVMSFVCGLFGTRHFYKVEILSREEQRKVYDAFRRKYGLEEDSE